MNTTIEFEACPSCGHAPPVSLAPDGERIDTTLELLSDVELQGETGPIDFAALRETEFVLCPNCALIFVTCRSSPEAARAYYGRLFHRIETPLPYDDLPIPERFLRRKAKLSSDLLATLDAHGVLEGVESAFFFRCDAGSGPRQLRDDYGVADVYALDLLPSCVRHAKEVYGGDHIARLHAPSVENPFGRDAYDLIICDEAFGHALDPVAVARDLDAMLSDHGTIVVFNEKDHAQILRSPKLFPHGMNFFHKQLYTRRSLRAFLELQGFAVTELPHPAVGKPHSLKNTKILYVLQRGEAATDLLPSDEVDRMYRLFSRWRSSYAWRKRFRRISGIFGESLFRPPATDEALGGAARSARSRRASAR